MSKYTILYLESGRCGSYFRKVREVLVCKEDKVCSACKGSKVFENCKGYKGRFKFYEVLA